MIVKRLTLNDLTPLMIERIKDELHCEYAAFVSDVKNKVTELYCLGESQSTYFAVRLENRTAIIVFIIGENLMAFNNWFLKTLIQTNLADYVVAFTKRKGMIKHFESVGAEHIGTYQCYQLGLKNVNIT